jgi:hypothetical protein
MSEDRTSADLLDLVHKHHHATKELTERHAQGLVAVGYRMALGEALKSLEAVYCQALQRPDSNRQRAIRARAEAEARKLCAGCFMSDGSPMQPPEWATEDAERGAKK